MPDHHKLLELVRISGALREALREAYALARAGESGEPLHRTIHYARDHAVVAPTSADLRITPRAISAYADS